MVLERIFESNFLQNILLATALVRLALEYFPPARPVMVKMRELAPASAKTHRMGLVLAWGFVATFFL